MDDRSPGRLRSLLSKLPIVESFHAAYSEPAFVKLVSRYRFGPAYWAYAAIVTAIFAVAILAGSVVLGVFATKQLMLEHFGAEIAATVTSVSSRTEFDSRSPGGRLVWTTINYEFTTSDGTTIEGKVERPANELPNRPQGDSFPVVYWERFPSVNLPRGFGNPLGLELFLAPVLLFLGIHTVLYARRFIWWRRRLLTGSAGTASTV